MKRKMLVYWVENDVFEEIFEGVNNHFVDKDINAFLRKENTLKWYVKPLPDLVDSGVS